MSEPGRILLYGRDSVLLDTRRMILAAAGFQVWASTRFEEIEDFLRSQRVDLLILGHTLSMRECEVALRAAETLRPAMKTLVLVSARKMPTGKYDAAISLFDGPRVLLATVKTMVSEKGPAPARVFVSADLALDSSDRLRKRNGDGTSVSDQSKVRPIR